MKKLNFDQRISFVREKGIPDGYGGFVPKNKTELTTFAHIEQLKQSRSLEKVQMKLPTAYRVTIYFRSEFQPKVGHLVFWRGKEYRIATTPTIDDTRVAKYLVFDIVE